MNQEQEKALEDLLNDLQVEVLRIENVAWVAEDLLNQCGPLREDIVKKADRASSLTSCIATIAKIMETRIDNEIEQLENRRRMAS